MNECPSIRTHSSMQEYTPSAPIYPPRRSRTQRCFSPAQILLYYNVPVGETHNRLQTRLLPLCIYITVFALDINDSPAAQRHSDRHACLTVFSSSLVKYRARMQQHPQHPQRESVGTASRGKTSIAGMHVAILIIPGTFANAR